MLDGRNGDGLTALPTGERPFRQYHGLRLRGKLLLLLGTVATLVGVVAVFVQWRTLERGIEELLTAERGQDGALPVADALGSLETQVTVLTATAAGVAILSLLVGARFFLRRLTRPLERLTRAADQVAMGNLDPAVRAGRLVNCWEIHNCKETQCAAYQNYEQRCWYIDDTPCEGRAARFPEKLRACQTCDVYRAHRGDEIQQLTDAFRHMTGALKDSREDLLRSSDFQHRLIRNSYNGVLATNAEGDITIFNLAAEKMLGIDRKEVIGKLDWHEFIDSSLERELDQPLSYEEVRRVRGFRLIESELRKPNGEMVSVLMSGINLFDRGRHLGRVFFFQDLRELKHLREALIRSERLAATGQAAAGISHSIRNILDGLRGGAYVFEQGKRDGQQGKMDSGWEMVQRNVEIISRLVVDLLDFSRERELRPVEASARDLIREAIEEQKLGELSNVELAVAVEPEAEQVVLDPTSFQQCLGQLIRNAMEAIPADRDGHVRVCVDREDSTVVFTVSDDGSGISAETQAKLQGGMYSTKGSKGTGLGMLVIQKSVDEHGGQLELETVEGEGTTMRITLPQPPKSVPLPAPPSGAG